MIARELMSDIVPVIRVDDTTADALKAMDVFKLSHVPVVNDNLMLGLISEAEIYDINQPEAPLRDYLSNLINVKVLENEHIFDVLNVISQRKVSVVPVVDIDLQYKGMITMQDVVDNFSSIFNINQPGAILILEVTEHDYQLSEIAQIVESNNAKILNLSLTKDESTGRIDVTIKISTSELGSILSAFERYGYTIKSYFSSDDHLEELLDKNYQSFIRYMNV